MMLFVACPMAMATGTSSDDQSSVGSPTVNQTSVEQTNVVQTKDLDTTTKQDSTKKSSTSNVNNYAGNIDAIAPDTFFSALENFITDLYNALGGIMKPLAQFLILVSVIAIAIGALFSSDDIKKYGFAGIFMAALGLLVFYGLPIIVGVVEGIANYFNSYFI